MDGRFEHLQRGAGRTRSRGDRMNRRLLTVLGACGVFVAIGVGAPIVLGNDHANASVVQALHGVAVLGFIVGLVGLLQFSGETAPAGDPVYQTPAPAPRILDSDPLGADADRTPLAERIEAAAEASARYSRSIGVLYYNLDSYRQIARSHGVPTAEAAMEFVVAMLQTRLRNTDRIERVGKGRFVACIVLLPDKQALLSVNGRLVKGMSEITVEQLHGAPIEFDFGLSIYPMHGYTGEDLIAHAEKECDSARAVRIRAEARRRKLAAEQGKAA